MKARALIMTALLAAATSAAHAQYTVKYEGGTLRDTKEGKALKLYVNRESIKLDRIIIQPASIAAVNYSQDARRVFIPAGGVPGAGIAGGSAIAAGMGALGLLARSPKHYIGLLWDKESVVLQAGSDWRGILADLEGVTGRTAMAVR